MNRDKIFHTLIGFFGVYLIYLALAVFLGPLTLLAKMFAILAGYMAMRFLAYAKEAYDEAHPQKHTKDMLDAEVTISGASLAVALFCVWVLISHG